MKPNVLDIKVVGNLGGTSRPMGIHFDAVAHLMEVLTNLYEYPKVAVLREYATNGRDALIAAGRGHLPVEISLPGALRNILEIRDRGIGLDADDIFEIYSMYGASTKRESDEFNGILGLGCKSALAITNQFSLIAVKDGIKTTAVIGLVEDHTGKTSILAEEETDEENGVTVIIPTKQGDSYEAEATNLFQYWEPGTVLVNGQDPSKIAEFNKFDDSIYFLPVNTFGAGKDIVVMGGVPYPVTNGSLFDANGRERFRTVAFVDMGTVNFTPSREGLRYTNLTTNALAEIRKHIKDTIKDRIRDEINAAPTKAKAYKVRDKWIETLGSYYMHNYITVEYRGEALPAAFPCDNWIAWKKVYTKSSYSDQYEGEMKYDKFFRASFNNMFIVNAPIDARGFMPNHQKGRFSKWAKGKGYENVKLLPNAKVFQSPWLDKADYTIIDWHKIDWPVIVRAPKGTVVKDYTIEVFNTADYFPVPTLVKDIPKTKTMLFLPASDKEHRGSVRDWLKDRTDVTVVMLKANQVVKFKKAFPQLELIYHYQQREINKLWAVAKSFEHKQLGSDTRQFIRRFDATRVTSKPMLEAFEAAKVQEVTPPEVMRYNSALEKMGGMTRKIRFERIGTTVFDLKLQQTYPLLNLLYDYRVQEAHNAPGHWKASLDHLYNYINSI